MFRTEVASCDLSTFQAMLLKPNLTGELLITDFIPSLTCASSRPAFALLLHLERLVQS